MQALWYYVQPPLEALRCVASLCAEAAAEKLRGAALLDLVHGHAARAFGDARCHTLLLRLLRWGTCMGGAGVGGTGRPARGLNQEGGA